MDELSQFLVDAPDGDDDMGLGEQGEGFEASTRQICAACGCTSQDLDPTKTDGSRLPFARRGKDFFCHVTHMLGYGEVLWGATWARMTERQIEICENTR